LKERLAAANHEVVHVVLTRIVDDDPFPDPAGFDGVLFTSVNAVVRSPREARWPRVGAVGPATARALEERGIRVDVIGKGGGRELAAAWGDPRGRRLLLPQAAQAHPDLAEALRRGGGRVTCAAVYRSEPLASVDRDPLERAGLICFFAPSQVRAFLRLGLSTGARLWGVGATTRAALAGLEGYLDALDDIV